MKRQRLVSSSRRLGAILIILSAGSLPAVSDSVRGSAVRMVTLEAREDLQPSLSIKAEEIAGVALAGETRFLQGIDVEIVVSEALRRYADSFAVSLYTDLEPPPEASTTSMEGKRALFQVLTYSSRIYLHIPIKADRAPDAEVFAPGSRIPDESFPVALLFTPIMKGVPDSVLERAFFMTFKPVIEQRGLLNLTLLRPKGFEDENVQVLLAGEVIDPDGSLVELGVGVHQIEVTSSAFKRETASFAIAAGQTTTVEVVLEPQSSYLTVEPIEGAQTFLDGERIDDRVGQRLELTEGSHSVRFKLGETSVSKRFDVRPGHSYHISLVLDVVLKED